MSKDDGNNNGGGGAVPLSAEKQQTDNFEYLVFDDQELANSYADNEASVKAKNYNVSPMAAAALSTRSENEEERAMHFQIWLRRLRKMTQVQMKEQERALKA